MMEKPERTFNMTIRNWISDLDCRLLLLLIAALSVLLFVSLSSTPDNDDLSLRSFISKRAEPPAFTSPRSVAAAPKRTRFGRTSTSKAELNQSRSVVCLVGTIIRNHFLSIIFSA